MGGQMRDQAKISLRGIASSGALERCIGEEVRKLDGIADSILGCHVVAEMLAGDARQGAKFAARLIVTLPGAEIVVNRERDDDIYIAVRDAFAAASLQLKDQMRRHRAEERTAK